MAHYETQVGSLPTNKSAVAASVGSLMVLYAEPVIAELWPQIAPALLAGPAFTSALAGLVGIFVALTVAWWVPDRAGVPNA